MEIPAIAKPATAAQTSKPRTGESDAANVDVSLWNTERDGQPELRLRELIGDAAKRAEAYLRSLSSRTISIDAEHSNADIDFVVVDEYSKIVRFISEIEKITPRPSWRRLEIRIEPARALAGQQAEPRPATDARRFRMTAQVRVIKYTPAKKETVPATGAPAEEKKMIDPFYPGDPDFLAKLYDLSLSIPDVAFVSLLQFSEGHCNLQINTQDRMVDLPGRMVFPYWKISSLTQRINSEDVCSFSIALIRTESGKPLRLQQNTLTPENRVATIVALNIFDPDRTQKTAADSGTPAVLPGSTSTPAAGQTASQTTVPAEPGVLVLEGTFEGRGSFHFIDGLVVYSHKEGVEPAGVKINGKSWTDLKKPVKLNADAFPVRIIRKHARGTVTLLPAEDFARLELNDHQDGSASYRIELGTK